MKFWLFIASLYLALCLLTYKEAWRVAPTIAEWVAANKAVLE